MRRVTAAGEDGAASTDAAPTRRRGSGSVGAPVDPWRRKNRAWQARLRGTRGSVPHATTAPGGVDDPHRVHAGRRWHLRGWRRRGRWQSPMSTPKWLPRLQVFVVARDACRRVRVGGLEGLRASSCPSTPTPPHSLPLSSLPLTREAAGRCRCHPRQVLLTLLRLPPPSAPTRAPPPCRAAIARVTAVRGLCYGEAR